MNETLTAADMTPARIAALHAEAASAGDSYLVDWCDLARAPHESCNADGSDLVGPEGMATTRTFARYVCVCAINLAILAASESL